VRANAEPSLLYDSPYGSVEGLKDGVLLEAGFDTISPNTARDISSWALDFARDRGLDVAGNPGRWPSPVIASLCIEFYAQPAIATEHAGSSAGMMGIVLEVLLE
jgi:hypothetical protein